MAKLDLSVLVKVLGSTALKGLNGDLAKVDKQATTTQNKLANAFNPKNLLLGGGVAIAATQAIGFLNDAAGKASDLEEAQGKVNVVFGEGADQVSKWAEGSAEGFLLSKSAALEAAGTYGNLFQAFGIGRESATEMSTTLVELAADMASFNNTSVDDALVALRSGLSGETEPLKRYGVALNDARLRAKALELGIYNGVGALNSAQKAQASYNLILEDTTLAQGDVERTGDNLANQQRRMAADIENAEAEIGKAWASIQLGAIKVTRSLGELVDQTGEDFGDIASFFTETQDWGEIFGEQREAVGRQMTAMELETQASALATVRAVEAEYIKGQPVIAREAGKIAGLFPSEIRARDAEIQAAAFGGMVAYAQGVLDGQNEPLVAQELMHRAMEEGLTEAAEVARLKGRLHSDELARGIVSAVPAVRAAAAAERAAIVERLEFLTDESWQWGYNIGSGLASGIESQFGTVRDAAGNLAAAVRGQIGIRSEPKDPNSPLRGITEWGSNLVKTYTDGIYQNLDLASSAGGALATRLSVSPSGGQEGASSSGSAPAPVTINLTVTGDLRASESTLPSILQRAIFASDLREPI